MKEDSASNILQGAKVESVFIGQNVVGTGNYIQYCNPVQNDRMPKDVPASKKTDVKNTAHGTEK